MAPFILLPTSNHLFDPNLNVYPTLSSKELRTKKGQQSYLRILSIKEKRHKFPWKAKVCPFYTIKCKKPLKHVLVPSGTHEVNMIECLTEWQKDLCVTEIQDDPRKV